MTKTKGRQSADFIIMSSESDFYQHPNIDNCLEYNDEYKLQDNEWFALDNFSHKDYCWDLLKHPFDATAYSNLPRTNYPNMNYLYSEQDGKFYFQKITNTKILQKKLVSFKINEEPVRLDTDYVVIINDIPDAVYDCAEDKLYFQRLSDITNVFVGIDELYREATEDETTTFLTLDIINLCQGFTADKVKTANRKRIKAAMDKYNNFSEIQKQKLPNYLRLYNADLTFDDNSGKFTISSEVELTNLLNGINQRYYTTEIDGEKRLASAVIKLQ